MAMIEEGYLYPKTIRLSDYISLASIRTNVYLFAQSIVGTVPWGAIPLFLVKFLNEDKGMTIGQATTIFLLFGAGVTVGTIVGGMWGGALLKAKVPYLPRFCAVTTFAGAGVALVLFIAAPAGNIVWMLLLGFIASFLTAMTGPNMRTMLLDTNVPENRGAIFSIFNLTDSVGTGIGKWFAGILSVMFGLNFAISVSAALWIPCAILLWLCSYIFQPDIKRLHEKMKTVAEQMESRTVELNK